MLAQNPTNVHPHKPVADDYTTGQRLYWKGYSDSRCANPVQVQGWYDACAEDSRGRAAYLTAMLEQDRTEPVDWDSVTSNITYNAYGDRVQGAW